MKRILACLTIALLLMSIVGCAGGSAPAGQEAGPDAGTDTQQAAGSDGGDVIKVGFYNALTGAHSLMGIQGQMGAQLAMNHVNEAGGINGRMITMIEYDDQANAEQAVKVVTRMLEVDRVHAIIGSMNSGNVLATADLVDKAQVLELGMGVSPIWTNQGFEYVYRGTSNSATYNQAIVDAMEAMGVTKLSVMTSSTEWAKTGWDDIKGMLGATAIEIAVEESAQVGDTDFTGQFAKIIESGADGVLFYANTEELVLQLKQLRQMGYDGYIYGPEPFGSPDIRNVAGDAANKCIFACGYLIPDEIDMAQNDEEQAFLEAWVAEYGELPITDVAYRSYDSMMILAEVFRTAESLEGPDLRKAILKMTDFKGIGGTFDFSDGSGDGLDSCSVYAIIDDKNVPFDRFLDSL